jgi:hypothetical protein
MVIFRVVAKRLCLAAVMFAFVTAISACGVVKLKSIPEELIPDDLKADIEAMATKGRPITDIKWRVYEVVDGRVLAACTFKQEFEPGVKLDVFWLQSYEVDEDGSRVLETDCGGGGGADPGRRFVALEGGLCVPGFLGSIVAVRREPGRYHGSPLRTARGSSGLM